jgi:hypothetical protein
MSEQLMTSPCKVQITLADGRKTKVKFDSLRELYVQLRYGGKFKRKLSKTIQK